MTDKEKKLFLMLVIAVVFTAVGVAEQIGFFMITGITILMWVIINRIDKGGNHGGFAAS